MSKKKKKTDREKLDKIRKGERRKALMDKGVYMIHKPKVVPNKKKYNRKDKPKPDADE
jgi:hypothetical protein